VATVEIGIEGLEQAIKDPATVSPEGERIEAHVDGVEIRRARTHADERGTLCEIFDSRWGFTDDPLVYAYHVTLSPGAIRG
jgi:dTDP-4-dehydrorhamnose 3,5-epimerase